MIDQIVKQRILESLYWKINCYTLNAASSCDKAVELREVGGLNAAQRPTPFSCSLYKSSLINPPREIIEESSKQRYFKYLTASAAVYIRLTLDPITVHRSLEPLSADYRKLRLQTADQIVLSHVDEFVDALLTEDRVIGLTSPRMPSRIKSEDVGLEPREPLVSE